MIGQQKTRTRHPLALRLLCRREWVEGQGTLSEIAEKHQLAHSTVIAWYRRDNWTAARNRWLAKQLSDSEPPAKPPSYTPNPKSAGAHAEMLMQLATQLKAVDILLENALSGGKANELQKLSAARQRLFEQWRILSGIPLPGSRRLPKERPLSIPPLELPDPYDVEPLNLPLPSTGNDLKPPLNPPA
jgi:hypothetical protein